MTPMQSRTSRTQLRCPSSVRRLTRGGGQADAWCPVPFGPGASWLERDDSSLSASLGAEQNARTVA
jgi:hypothetical protein